MTKNYDEVRKICTHNMHIFLKYKNVRELFLYARKEYTW